MRSHRGRMRPTVDRRWRRWGSLYAVLALASWVLLLFLDPVLPDPTSSSVVSAADARLEATSTPHLRDAAAALRSDQVYVDPVLAGSAPAGAEDGSLHDALRSSSMPVYLTVMPVDDTEDGSGGDGDLTLARLHHLVDHDGIYLLDAGGARCFGVVYRDSKPEGLYCHDLDRSAIDQLRKDAKQSPGDAFAALVVYPIFIGGAAIVVLQRAFELIGWLRRRSRSVGYLGMR